MSALGRIAIVLACLTVTLAGVAPRAHAQDDDADARAHLHFASGEDLFRRGEYEGALREFEESYAASPRAELLYNIGSCHERLAHYAAAADAFEHYLEEATDPVDPEALSARAHRLRSRVASDTPTTTIAEPSAHDERERAQPDGTARASDPVGTPSGGSGLHPAAWVVLGGAALTLVAFAVVGGLALAEDATLSSECGTACAPARVETLSALGTAADVTLIAGAALAVTGLVLALALPADAPEVGVSVDGSSALVQLGTTF